MKNCSFLGLTDKVRQCKISKVRTLNWNFRTNLNICNKCVVCLLLFKFSRKCTRVLVNNNIVPFCCPNNDRMPVLSVIFFYKNGSRCKLCLTWICRNLAIAGILCRFPTFTITALDLRVPFSVSKSRENRDFAQKPGKFRDVSLRTIRLHSPAFHDALKAWKSGK